MNVVLTEDAPTMPVVGEPVPLTNFEALEILTLPHQVRLRSIAIVRQLLSTRKRAYAQAKRERRVQGRDIMIDMLQRELEIVQHVQLMRVYLQEGPAGRQTEDRVVRVLEGIDGVLARPVLSAREKMNLINFPPLVASDVACVMQDVHSRLSSDDDQRMADLEAIKDFVRRELGER